MRAAVMLCDRIHAVSPTYAEEICDAASGHGEGLHAELSAARSEGRLQGILNGCEYPGRPRQALPRPAFLRLLRSEITRWIGESVEVRSSHLLAREIIDRELAGETAAPVRTLTFVGRLTAQKFGLLTQRFDDGRPALAHLLDGLHDEEQLIVLGSGDAAIEQFLTSLQVTGSRLLFLRGFSEELSEQLYARGDLFLMPSCFEPCGIAQMLAMRDGQPCLVNRTGGLADTVKDGVDGFVFDGDSDDARARAMLERLAEALQLLRSDARRYDAVREAARAARFPWATAAEAYGERLYDVTDA
jgi:starch synthase